MTNVEALKDLYVALGGSASTVAGINTNAEMIAKISTVISAGELAVLPTVTSADNGKVLTVVNGAWSAENPAVSSQDSQSET